MPQQSARAQIVERRTYLRPLDQNGTKFETPEQAWRRVIDHQRWLWERAQGHMLSVEQEAELEELYTLFMERKATVSGRTRWLGGTDITKKFEIANFNCAAAEVYTVEDIVDMAWLLLCGAGVGFSPKPGKLHGWNDEISTIEIIRSKKKLPVVDGVPISDPKLKGRSYNIESIHDGVWKISIGDSAQAWARALGKVLQGPRKPVHTFVLDTTEIRPAGYRLSGFGWISAGDEKLVEAIEGIAVVLNRSAGKLLSKIDILDIMNWIGTILASRRSAQIAMVAHGSSEWEEFAVAKKNHYERGLKHRAMSNNTLMFDKKPTRQELEHIFNLMAEAGGSEPGFLNREELRRRAPDASLVNPCGEAALPANPQAVEESYGLEPTGHSGGGLCNLVELYLTRFNGDYEALTRAAHLIGRANYRQTLVDLRDGVLQIGWHMNNQTLRLCGVGVSGVAGWEYADDAETWQDLATHATDGAHSMADELGTQRSKRVTLTKPSGCLPLWSTVVTHGGIKTIAELMENHVPGERWTPTSFSMPDRDKGRLYATKTFDNGIDEVFKVKTTFNLPLAATAHHKWRLASGEWRRTVDLVAGDELVVEPGLYRNETPYMFKRMHPVRLRPHGRMDSYDIHQPEEMNDDIAWLIGYLYGDGCMSENRRRFRFTDANVENVERALGILKDQFNIPHGEVKRCTDRDAYTLEVASAQLWRWFIVNDLYKDLSEGVPAAIRNGHWKHAVSFIAGIFDADGCRSVSDSGAVSYVFTQSLPEFVESFQQTAWAVGLAFGRSPNTQGQNKQQDKCIYLCTLSAHTTADAAAHFVAQSTKCREYPTPTWSIVRKVKVLSVESAGFVETADIEVAGEHRYFAFGGVETHNTQSKVGGLVNDELGEGIHNPMARFLFNKIGFSKDDPIVAACAKAGYDIMVNPYDSTARLITFPVEYAGGTFTEVDIEINGETRKVEVNTESAVEQLERYHLIQNNYVQHNASVTISYSPEEVPEIIDWMMEHWDTTCGVSFLYRTDPTKTAEDLGYPYLPQQPVDEATFRAYADRLLPVDLSGTDVEELLDLDECAGGACPIR